MEIFKNGVLYTSLIGTSGILFPNCPSTSASAARTITGIPFVAGDKFVIYWTDTA